MALVAFILLEYLVNIGANEMRANVCITGLGVVNPSGIGVKQFWDNVVQGVNSIQKISRFDCKNFPLQVAGEVTDFKAAEFMPRRFVIKMDRFSHYATAAAGMALLDSGLDLSAIDPFKIGVWLGNNSGGWDICEQGLYELYRDGAAFVNPWQATAWFLSSAQGYVSIVNKLKGMSKSFCSDRTSDASALYYATQSLMLNRCDVIVSGGTEAPITPFGLTCFYETGEFAKSENAIDVYKPFAKDRQGLVLGEGSATIILEKREHAIKRGARIYGEIVSASISNDFDGKGWKGLSGAISKVITDAGLQAEDIDLVMPEGAATDDSDNAEARAFSEVFGANSNVPITCPKAGFGHLYGASATTDIVCGILAAEQGLIPPTPNMVAPDFNLNVICKTTEASIRNILFTSRAREGGNVVFIVSTRK